MSSFGCCFWWFLLGALLGWLLNYWLCKGCKNKNTENKLTPPPAPAPKVMNTPAASAPVTKVAATPTPAPKKAPVKKAATPTKSKPKAKPKAAPAKAITIDLKAARAANKQN